MSANNRYLRVNYERRGATSRIDILGTGYGISANAGTGYMWNSGSNVFLFVTESLMAVFNLSTSCSISMFGTA